MPTLATLLPALERADAGSLRLDLLIAYLVDAASSDDLRRIALFDEADYGSERVAALLDFVPQPYTTRLDAAIPGENIVLAMYSPARNRWAAIHRRPDGSEDLHWGASEPLARRIAALHAFAAPDETAGRADGEQAPVSTGGLVPRAAARAPAMALAGGAAETREGLNEPWKILF
jgi:hypothetical protein